MTVIDACDGVAAFKRLIAAIRTADKTKLGTSDEGSADDRCEHNLVDSASPTCWLCGDPDPPINAIKAMKKAAAKGNEDGAARAIAQQKLRSILLRALSVPSAPKDPCNIMEETEEEDADDNATDDDDLLDEVQSNPAAKAAKRHCAITSQTPPHSPTDMTDGQSFGLGTVSADERDLVRAVRRLDDHAVRTTALTDHIRALELAEKNPEKNLTAAAKNAALTSRQLREVAARTTFRPVADADVPAGTNHRALLHNFVETAVGIQHAVDAAASAASPSSVCYPAGNTPISELLELFQLEPSALDAMTAHFSAAAVSTVGGLRQALEPAPYNQQLRILADLSVPLGHAASMLSKLGLLSQ